MAVDGKISGDPAAPNLTGLVMAGVQGGTNVKVPGELFQPIDADLTALAAIGTAVQGDLIYSNANGTWARHPKGTGYTFLRQNAAGTAPEWASALPGYDTNSFSGGSESARIAAMYAAAPTNPYAYRSDSHIGIIRDTAPLNYNGTRAAFVLQRRDTGSLASNELAPGAMFQFTSTGNGVVNAGADLSLSVSMGLTSVHTKTGDGSAHCSTGIGELGAYGPGLYNELGGSVGTLTNTGSLHGTISGFEWLLRDSPDAGVTDFDTTMNAVIGRVERWNGGTRKSRNFFASSEGDKPLDAILGVNTQGFPQWVQGIDLIGATFTSGQAVVLPNNTSIAAMNAAGNSRKPLLFLSSTDETWLTGAGTTSALNFGNSALAKSFVVTGVATAANWLEVSGALSGQAPLSQSKGSDADVGYAYATKGAGVHSFYTNSASLSKQVEISHVAGTVVNYLTLKGATTTASPVLSVGGETNAGLTVATKGTGEFLLQTNSTDAVRVDSSQNVLKGSAIARTLGSTNATTASFQVHGTTNGGAASEFARWTADANPPQLFLFKSRGAAVGTRGAVSSGDILGQLVFAGDDGTNGPSAALIKGEVDTTPGAGDMPGRLVLMTTADGAVTPTERLRIDSNGFSSVSGSLGRGAPVTKTADFTVAATENWLINNKAAATCTVTLPAAASFVGREITINNYQAFTVVSASSNVIPLVGGAAGTAILAATAGKWATLVSNGTNWVIMQGA